MEGGCKIINMEKEGDEDNEEINYLTINLFFVNAAKMPKKKMSTPFITF
jgi:hypothetical protein